MEFADRLERARRGDAKALDDLFAVLARSLGRSSGSARVLWTRALRRLRQVLSGDA
jgi:hypothetical protein